MLHYTRYGHKSYLTYYGNTIMNAFFFHLLYRIIFSVFLSDFTIIIYYIAIRVKGGSLALTNQMPMSNNKY